MMRSTNIKRLPIAVLGVMAITSLAVAQNQQPGQPFPDQGQPPANPQYNPQYGNNQQRYPGPGPTDYPQQQQAGGPNYGPPSAPPPAHLTIKPGTFVSVRINQWLSSDRNQAGDSFAATLDQPLVVDGVVVAQRGQTIGARVSEAQKAGRVQGTSRLGLQLTDLTLVDGQVMPIQTSMVNRNGSTSVGRDAAGIAVGTGLGAAIGAGADRGTGAAIGAGAGAAAGIIGVLLTRGNPTVVYPESVLTFRLDAPVEIATDHAPQAFRYADQQDYDRGGPGPQPRMAGGAPPPYGRPYGAPYPYYPAPYPYAYGYGYYGPGYGVIAGPGFYFRGRWGRR
jgi:hypothetical protein